MKLIAVSKLPLHVITLHVIPLNVITLHVIAPNVIRLDVVKLLFLACLIKFAWVCIFLSRTGPNNSS